MEQLVVATDYYSHLLCLQVEWDLVLGIHKHLGLRVQDKVQQGRQVEGSRCNFGPQLGKAPQPHQDEG